MLAGSTSSHWQSFVKFAKSGSWPFSTRDSVAGDKPIARAVARTPTLPRFSATKRPNDFSEADSDMSTSRERCERSA